MGVGCRRSKRCSNWTLKGRWVHDAVPAGPVTEAEAVVKTEDEA